MKNSYTTLGVSGNSRENLNKELEKLGFEYTPPELGGGPVEAIVRQTVALLSLHEFWVGFFSALAASRIEKIMSRVYQWSLENWFKQNVKPEIEIFVYRGKKSYKLTLEANKKYFKKEIIELIKQSLKKRK